MLSIKKVDLQDRRVLIRADLNVPVENGVVRSSERINASLKTINYALKHGAAVQVMSHFGRPKEGQTDDRYSLRPVANFLQQVLGRKVEFISDWRHTNGTEPGTVAVLENVRFLTGETSNDKSLSRRMAKLCDVFVMDAFGAAHRKHASTVGVMEFAPKSCAGLLLKREVKSLKKALNKPCAPVVSIVGGAKVADKLPALRRLAQMSDTLIVGGGIANTFLHATGYPVGSSLHEPELKQVANEVLELSKQHNCEIPMPVDVIVSEAIDDYDRASQKRIEDIDKDDMIFDIGSQTCQIYSKRLMDAGTIIWNGPVGVFERAAYSKGTRAIAKTVGESSAFSVAGGGDTLSALNQFGKIDEVSYVSTGGGAFLEYIQGRSLPAIEMLEN